MEPFEKATVELSSENEVTLSKIIVVARGLMSAMNKLKVSMKNETYVNFVNTMITVLVEHFQRVEHHLQFSTATFLDPRFKSKAFVDNLVVGRLKETVISKMKSVNIQSEESDISTEISEEAVTGDSAIGSIWKNTGRDILLSGGKFEVRYIHVYLIYAKNIYV